MAEVIGKISISSSNYYRGNNNYLCDKMKKLSKVRPSLAVRSPAVSGDVFGGRVVAVGGNQRGVSIQAVAADNAKMSFGIKKPVRWWEKGVKPNMKEVTGAEDLVDSLLTAGDKLVVVDFFSPGCGGCKALHPKRSLYETDTAYLLLYVGDIVLTASYEILSQRLIHSLHQEEFAMTDLGSLKYFLVDTCDIESTLGANGDLVSNPTVCLHMHHPREPHYSTLKWILRYVRGTMNYGVQLYSSSTSSLVAYLVADCAGCPTTRRSTFGYAADATLPATPTPLSPDYVPASPDYTSDSDSDSETFEEDPQEAYLDESSEEDPLVDDSSNEDPIEADGPLHAHVTPTPPIQPSPTFLDILVQPGQEIPLRHPYNTRPSGRRLICTPRKMRYISPSSSSALSSPSPSPSCKRCRSPSLPPPPLPSSPLPTLLLPCKRFRMTSSHQETTNETTTEAIIPVRLRESSSVTHVLLVTGESIHHTIPLLATRLVRLKDQIEEIQGHLEEILLESVESVQQEIKTVCERVEAAEQQIEVLHESLGFSVQRSLPWREILGREENVGFNLVRCYFCPSSIEKGTAEGVGLLVVKFHTGNHRRDYFTPLETIQRFLGIIRSRSLSSTERRPLIRMRGYVIKPPSRM
nr:thioredoxin-like 1-1, chloroplastic [Tanacetum cinerariifolium]